MATIFKMSVGKINNTPDRLAKTEFLNDPEEQSQEVWKEKKFKNFSKNETTYERYSANC